MSESVFEIHDWTLRVDDNMLCRPEREVYLEPRLVNLLRFLASHAGTVFCRDVLINEVWDGAEVTDQVVTQSIFELRKILKDGRNDAADYIVTVPKRGYKLVAPVRPLQVVSVVMADEQPASEARSAAPSQPVVASDEYHSAAPFPAGPLTRAISTHARDGKSRRRMIGFDLFVAVVLVTIVSLLSYQHASPQVHSMLDPGLLVFRFHSGIDGDNENVRLADGITRALMGEVAAATPLRVQYGATALMGGIRPGKELSVRVSRQPGGTYLDLEYRNINTNRVLFSHQYQISRHNVHEVLQESSQDLLRVLDQADATPGAGWPTDNGALMALMEAHYYTNKQDPVALRRGIELLDASLLAQPDQPLLLAERYLAGEALATLAGNPQSDHLQQIGAHLASVVQGDAVLPARVWEALTLQAILGGQQQEANRLLAQAAGRGRTVLYHILKGKLAELDGRPEVAGDAYSQAFLMEATEQTYLLCQRLGFYSNMETLAPALFNTLGQSKVKLF
ncbi:lysine decarboxylation/transport transcriptional activator CadC [Aeromonas lusitana]|uniref:Transcriptional regulator CadC n=1 Tax=Aeromonas lusitana TaxID=931529 RepID=A0A2M8HF64_9GAMM|nr:lysine decarboxylation/transport transcriptional activator CadC [Aeromonas lusitana]PJC95180.1 transcriptional regulator CadC [Aeromonas lusitana]